MRKLSPRIIPGTLTTQNRYACDWGWQGLIAYGCNNVVIVLDPITLQVLQTLQHHTSNVSKIKWRHENYHHDMHAPYTMQLVACDTGGQLMLWDVKDARLLNTFGDSGKAVVEIEWLKHSDVSNHLLLALHATSSIVLWNADTGVRLWKRTYTDPLFSMAVDPTDGKSMTVMSSEYIMYLDEFSPTTAPPEKGRKFYMTSSIGQSASSSSVGSTSNSNLGGGGSNTKLQSRSTFQKVKSWAGDIRGRGDDESPGICECLQIVYLPAGKGRLLLLFPREILILDLRVGQAIASFAIENNSPSFQLVIPCSQRDTLFCLHENGSITMRVWRFPATIPYHGDETPENIMASKITVDLIYDSKCQSDVFRLSRSCRIMGFSKNPVSEKDVAVVLSDGRVVSWSLSCTKKSKNCFTNGLFNNNASMVNSETELSNLIASWPEILRKQEKDRISQTKLKFLLHGIYEGVSQNPTCVRMCPPLTTKNGAYHKPLAAIGCSTGMLQIFNAGDGSLRKQFSIHTNPIRGIEWVTLFSIVSFAHSSGATTNSEILLVDIISGYTKPFPTSRCQQSSLIVSVKVSYLKQYVLTLYKNHSAELWDANTLMQMREFPSNFPPISAIEWSSGQHVYKSKKKNAQKTETLLSTSPVETASQVFESVHTETKAAQSHIKEDLLLTDTDGNVRHHIVEGTSIKDGTVVPPESGMGVIACIAWKGDLLVLGDVDGNLNIWDIKGKKPSRVFPSHRGVVKRVKFAPGKGNYRLLILFNDGIDIWEANEVTIVSSLKTSRDQLSVLDADWLSSDLPLLLLSDGSLRVLDAVLKSSNSSISDKDFEDELFCPRAMDVKPCFYFKHLLQHQPWNESYSLDESIVSGSEFAGIVKRHLTTMPRNMKHSLLSVATNIAQRCILVAQLFGDESESDFWKVAHHYVEREANRKKCPLHLKTIAAQKQSNEDLLMLDDDDITNDDDGTSKPVANQEKENSDAMACTCFNTSLPAAFDILCDNDAYQKLQLYQIALRDSRRTTTDHSRSCAEQLILMDETDRAVQILLETEMADGNAYNDSLRACLVATVRSSGASQSTIKLVATNLIASGKLSEGVELLCLVDKGLDACRYLQTYGSWEKSVWLAKIMLSRTECINVLTKWVDHLLSLNQKTFAVLILLSLGNFNRALEVMFSLGQIDRAILFLEYCLEKDLLSLNDETHLTMYENIFLEYARYHHRLKNEKAFSYYCGKTGGRGKRLIEELGLEIPEQ